MESQHTNKIDEEKKRIALVDSKRRKQQRLRNGYDVTNECEEK